MTLLQDAVFFLSNDLLAGRLKTMPQIAEKSRTALAEGLDQGKVFTEWMT
jgi:hypothetical protein